MLVGNPSLSDEEAPNSIEGEQIQMGVDGLLHSDLFQPLAVVVGRGLEHSHPMFFRLPDDGLKVLETGSDVYSG